jgi:hypothetical protein
MGSLTWSARRILSLAFVCLVALANFAGCVSHRAGRAFSDHFSCGDDPRVLEVRRVERGHELRVEGCGTSATVICSRSDCGVLTSHTLNDGPVGGLESP